MLYYKIKDELNGGFQYGQTDGGLPNGAIELTQAEIEAYKLSKVKKTASITLETARKKVQYENVTYKGKTYFATPTAQLNITTTLLQLMLIILKDKNIITNNTITIIQVVDIYCNATSDLSISTPFTYKPLQCQ